MPTVCQAGSCVDSTNRLTRVDPTLSATASDGPAIGEVDDSNIALLADAVGATDALLALNGIPRKIVVDKDMSELKVPSLASGLGRDEYSCLVTEAADRLLLLFGPDRSIEENDRDIEVLEQRRQVLLGLPELSEDH